MTHAAFLEQVGSKFMLHVPPNLAKETELMEVSRPPSIPGQPPNSFSLVFRTANDFPFKQHLYRLEHPQLGQMEIFLVPIGPDSQGMRLEAVFS